MSDDDTIRMELSYGLDGALVPEEFDGDELLWSQCIRTRDAVIVPKDLAGQYKRAFKRWEKLRTKIIELANSQFEQWEKDNAGTN